MAQPQALKQASIELDCEEEILNELSNRFVMFPIKYNAIWQMYKKAESAFWTAEELDLSKDMDDWNKLNENEQHFIKHILAFFAGSDGIVNENLGVRFMNDVKAPEARAFYGFQIAMENIHCVAHNTEILTRKGYITIGSVECKVQEVWNGKEFSNVMIMKTSESSPVYLVRLSNGMELTCTPNHEWLISGESCRIPTHLLKSGMRLCPFEYPMETFEWRDQELFANPELHGEYTFKEPSEYNIVRFNMKPQHYVPVNYSIATKVKWLNGFVKNASVTSTNDLSFVHDVKEFLQQVQLLLTTMHIESNLDHLTKTLTIPGNAHGVKGLADLGVLVSSDLYKKASEPEKLRPYMDNLSIAEVVFQDDVFIPTYCFEEPLNHTGIFNGILTGQSETYSLLIDTYIKDTREKRGLLDAINTIPCIKKKAEWAMRWITDKEAPFAMRLLAFAVVEGIFFSGAFCSIFWLKERGLMPGLCMSNEFISRDESLHTEFAIMLYTMLKHKLDQNTVLTIVKEAVEIEEEFINESIPCNLLGMNTELMSEYIRFVADRLVVQLGYDKIYNARNPFAFMDRICLSQKTNFFEFQTTSEYAKANVGHGQHENIHNFSLDADF